MEQEAKVYRGLAASGGLVFAPAVRFETHADPEIPRYRVPADHINAEIARFYTAIDKSLQEVIVLAGKAKASTAAGEAGIFDSHRMMLEDTFFIDTVVKAIRESGDNAEWALSNAFAAMLKMMEGMDDEYMRERTADVYDVRNRLLSHLDVKHLRRTLVITQPSVVIADNISPSDAVGLPRRYVRGLATEQGSLTAHVTILARALGVPAVVGIGDSLDDIQSGEEVALDGFHGVLWARPDDKTKSALLAETATQRAALDHRRRLADQPAITPDGVRVTLLANTDHSVGFDAIGEHGAEGIGLYRTEYLWIGLNREPTEAEQYRAYSEVIRACNGKPATIRVLDIGGDKMVGDLHKAEANPFLGNRSVRYLLNNPSTFRAQVRAILRAAIAGPCHMMYPMIATVDELRRCNAFVERCKDELEADGIPFRRDVPTGVMIEIPSAALQADILAAESDFFSIGTNDLVQYTFAVDRGNESVASLYQPMHPVILGTIDKICRAAKAHNRSVCVCGEMASDPVAAILLVGLGIRQLSMSPNLIPRIKELICRIAYFDMQRLVDQLRRLYARGRITGPEEIIERCREVIRRYAPDVINT